jgi:D-alanine-D-alanine ligase
MNKLRVGILFGGRSGEHEVSLLSAASVLNAIDRSRYDVVPIGISKDGRWLTAGDAERLLESRHEKSKSEDKHLRAGDPDATASAMVLTRGSEIAVSPVPSADALKVDVVFPVLHGTFGEDGTIQGLLELADLPYVGAGVLGSAAGMDKDVMKRLFREAGLPVVKGITVKRAEWRNMPKKVKKTIEEKLNYPVFVKPANLGSSVGISKVHDASELATALNLAAQHDGKLIVEQGVGGKKHKAREIEVSVLGNEWPKASVPGEIVPMAEFYDYAAKYLDEGSQLIIPAKLNRRQTREVQELALRAFSAVEGAGLARVDFLMDPSSKVMYVNEINTMPGFTSISMYPKLWAASGVPYTELITKLIELAMERHAEKKQNQYCR